ncbi:hypothetical protein PFICI_07254 [Pestalotiopsis fici W106-1]|uniref:Uncharacterized protein n=1 Tax=Pestalotiopsis fici (strain W106-1 / CGMCC3.15140) TaxID=1229662 RepID=W3XA40_PESFW|nr:uncharacterized protein PFICI_07254 [Pestalotiopsis fici W106-1]ETS82252.1 hypothetical protein PFICI_07254 [Pestalotiopsis fici W106-1]
MARFRPLSIAKRRDHRPSTPDTLYTMSSMSSSGSHCSSNGRPLSRDYDTGFPELPRTTTWRHPEANTSPDACISAEDIDPAKALQRHHKHFLHSKYKRTTSHGRITSEMELEFLKSQEALNSTDSAIGLEDDHILVVDDAAARPSSRDGAESIVIPTDGFLKAVERPSSPTDSQYSRSGESSRRRSLFSRLRHHKH